MSPLDELLYSFVVVTLSTTTSRWKFVFKTVRWNVKSEKKKKTLKIFWWKNSSHFFSSLQEEMLNANQHYKKTDLELIFLIF